MAKYAQKLDGSGPRKTKRRPKPPRLSGRYKAIQEGTLAIEDLTDEEIFRGKLLNDKGDFRGRYTDAVPRKFYDAMINELMRRWQMRVNAELEPALQVLKDIMQNPRLPADARYKSAVYMIERAAGKVPEKTDMKLTVEKWEADIEGVLVDTEEAGDK